MQRLNFFAALLGAAVTFLSFSARAHVVLEYQVAPAGSSYKASFKLGHGCGTSPTRQVSVAIPLGVRSARPMPKAGWTVELQRADQEVTRVIWTARTAADMLASEHYDEFAVVARMPYQPGPLYWPVHQVCEAGRHDWVEVPRAGQNRAELKNPAPVLEILPAGDAGGHQH